MVFGGPIRAWSFATIYFTSPRAARVIDVICYCLHNNDPRKTYNITYLSAFIAILQSCAFTAQPDVKKIYFMLLCVIYNDYR